MHVRKSDGIVNVGHPYRGIAEAFSPIAINKKYGGIPDTVLVMAEGTFLSSFSSATNWNVVNDGVEMEFEIMTFETFQRNLDLGFTTNGSIYHYILTDSNLYSYDSGSLELKYGSPPTSINFNTRRRYARISNLDWHTIKIVSKLSAGNEQLFYDGELVASGPLTTTTGSGICFFNILGSLEGPLVIRLKKLKITVDGSVIASNFFADPNTNQIICVTNPAFNMVFNNAEPFGEYVRFSKYRPAKNKAIALLGGQTIVIPSTLQPLGSSVVNTFSFDISLVTGLITSIAPTAMNLIDSRDVANDLSPGFYIIFNTNSTVHLGFFDPISNANRTVSFNNSLLNGIRNIRFDFYGTQRGVNFSQNVDVFFDNVNVNALCVIATGSSFDAQIPSNRQFIIGNRNQATPANFVNNTYFESCRFYPNDPERLNPPIFELNAKDLDIPNSRILDSSGNNKHGNLNPVDSVNSPQQITMFSPYSIGLELNGTTRYGNVPNPFTASNLGLMDTRRPMILKVVIRNSYYMPSGSLTLISRMQNSGAFRGFELRINSAGQISYYNGQDLSANDYLEVATVASIYKTPELYFEVEVRYDGSKSASGVQIFVNKVQVPTVTIFNSCTGNNNDVTIPLTFFHRQVGVNRYAGNVYTISARFGTIGGGLASCLPMFEYEANSPLLRLGGTPVRLVSSVQRNSIYTNYLIPYLQFINNPPFVQNINEP